MTVFKILHLGNKTGKIISSSEITTLPEERKKTQFNDRRRVSSTFSKASSDLRNEHHSKNLLSKWVQKTTELTSGKVCVL